MENEGKSTGAQNKANLALVKRLEQTAFLREKQILGDPKAEPPVPPIIPVKRSTWWQGIKEGRFPAPVKLSPRCTAWRSADILKLIEEINVQG